MNFKKKIIFVLSIGLGGVTVLYLILSTFIYYRSTFFIYPAINDKYEVKGKIDTPEEALETCRSNLGIIMRENFWDSKLRRLKAPPLYSSEGDRYFQIRVFKYLNGAWGVSSSIESEDSKECFNCFRIRFGHRAIGRCDVDSDGKMLLEVPVI